ncbi:site-2 protease family protein [bacterium]|nr:site-2 protease family protein [candidate division CSSED10-310 bacterium]
MSPDLIVLQVFILLLGLTIHEFGHAWVADRMGDPTPRAMGRVTLNPLAHIDPIGTVVFPLVLIFLKSNFLFGWAKPVPINPAFIRSRHGHLLISFAGAAGNIVLAVILGITGRFLPLLGNTTITLYLEYFCFLGVSLNLILAIFNLIPIPPLDGGHIAMELLPKQYSDALARIEPFGFIIIIVLFQLDVLDKVLFPLVRFGRLLLLGA